MPDPHRPRYHFLPPKNWMNDPNGLIQWQGTYHLFYQHNPNAAYWGDMHWGHAAGPDLVHWQHLPIALAPTPGGLDQSGVWSGCAVDWDGVPTFVYTARNGELETVCLATSRDNLRTWEKHPGNPVISQPPEGIGAPGFRDPYVWRADGRWWMVIGTGIAGQGGAILLYTSLNLTDWEYLGPLVVGDRTQQEPYPTGEMWECPNFFPLGGKHVLLISAMDINPGRSLYTLYMIGDYQENRFHPQKLAKLDGGDLACYAPQAFLDEQGRRLMFGWAREMRSQEASNEAGWSGVMTLPRLLDLTAGGWLQMRPAPEVETLRQEGRAWENLRVEPADPTEVTPGTLSLDGLNGGCQELDVSFRVIEARTGSFGLWVRRSPGGEEQTEIRFDLTTQQLTVDTFHASLDSAVEPARSSFPLELEGQERLRLRVFLDQSILEVYANERAVITARIYPSREDSQGIVFFTAGQPVEIERLQFWPMQAVE